MRRADGFANPAYLLILSFFLMAAVIAVPRVLRARERRRNLEALAVLRGAIARYAADTGTKGPPTLSDLTKNGKYLPAIPEAAISGRHDPSSEVHAMSDADTGGWGYSGWPGDAREGKVWINCTHTDAAGRAWNSY